MKSFLKKHLGDYAYPIVIVIVALVVVGIIAAVVYKNRDKVEAQRTARVIEINGPCNILREGAVINAVADMPLYSGDTFYSGIDASARIMIDDDKFLYLDSTTRINFSASGTPDETHTLIFVETGSMLTEVKEKLADGESFDIVTPNSFMEIHGTKTLTEVVTNASGAIRTSTAVIEGNVKYSTVIKQNGRLIHVPEPMSEGDSMSALTKKEELADKDEMLGFADANHNSQGNPADSSTYEESGIVKEDADFSDKTLDNALVVLGVSEKEDEAAGKVVSDSDGDGVSNSKENVNALRNNKVADGGDEDSSDEDEESEEERLAREEEERLAREEEERLEKEEEERLEREEAEKEARLKAEEEARRRAEQEQQTQEIIAIEQAQAQVQENLQTQEAERLAAEEEAARQAAEQAKIDQDRKENAAREAAERAAAEAAAQESSDVHTSDSHDIPDDEEHGGTFTGYFSETGFPLYVDSDEEYYYLDETAPDGIVYYTGSLLTEPPSTT